MYTKNQFGKSLKEKIRSNTDRKAIGEWCYATYFENMLELEDGLRDVLLHLNTMELGEEFYFTYDELDEIADNLIVGKSIKK